MGKLVLVAGALVLCAGAFAIAAEPSKSKVTFDPAGIAQVDGKPFFPVGIFTYELNSTVLAEIHEQQFNTILNGFQIEDLDLVDQHGLMAVCFTGEDWIKAARPHPALLAWYLTDEPEGHSKTPESERERYLKLKETDPDHPIGLCHFLFEAIAKYKDACDLTMSDVYPVTANRDVPLANVGVHIDEVHRVHGANWPTWVYIQVFGGPDTDGGKWAQPLPHEVRCMAFIALAHRATGILYFSYWPKAPRTWDSIGRLNRDIHRIVPWLVAKGTELEAKASAAQVHVRARKVGAGGIIIAVNTKPTFINAEIAVPGLSANELRMPLTCRTVPASVGKFRDTLGPYAEKVYTWGPEPLVDLATRE
jgi:hypothetical protein